MKEIKTGDKFVCIKKVIMDTNEVEYKKGFIYYSDLDECITDKHHNTYHRWSLKECEKYFIKIKN